MGYSRTLRPGSMAFLVWMWGCDDAQTLPREAHPSEDAADAEPPAECGGGCVLKKFFPVESGLLRAAARGMESYREETGRYATTWYMLGEHNFKPRPLAADGARWTPNNDYYKRTDTDHTYVIEHADAESYLIVAYDLKGRATW